MCLEMSRTGRRGERLCEGGGEVGEWVEERDCVREGERLVSGWRRETV